MLLGRGALRSVPSYARSAPLTGQLGSSTRGFATGRIGGGHHVCLSTSGVSPLTRLRSGAIAGSVTLGPVPSSNRALSFWGSKKSEPPAAETAAPSTPPQPEATSHAATSPQPAADVAAAADATTATQSSGWSLWNWGSKPAPQPQPPAADLPSQAPAEPASTTAAVSEPAATSAVHPDTVSSDLSKIITSDLDAYGSVSAIPEKIGYLHTLGIEFGWGTTSMLQWLLEHVHVYSGLPWWGSILATTVLLRAILWKPVLMGQEATTRLNIMKQSEPNYEKAMGALREATVARDTVGTQAARLAMKTIEQKHGVNKWMPFINFVQLPIGFGMFRILRAMADLPVPSLETGGCLWFTDLTVPDPWYILPLVGPLSMIAAMRMTNRYSNTQQKKMSKSISLVLGPVGLLFTSFMPAGVQFYFVTAGVLGLFQTTLMFSPAFRRMVGMTPLPAPKDNLEVSSAESKSFLAGLKDSYKSAQEVAASKMSESSQKKESQKKLAEEARLQAEYYESLRERMAELEKKMKRRP